jgi:hypothetical protein
MLGELHRQDRAERIAGVGQAVADAERLLLVCSDVAMIGVSESSAPDRPR